MNGVNSFFSGPLFMHEGYFQSLMLNIIVNEKSREPKEITYYEYRFARNLDEQLQNLRDGETTAVIIPIKQPIIKYSFWDYLGTKFFDMLVRKLDANAQVSAIVFDVDSGGGSSFGTSEFADTIHHLETPTIAYTDGMLCSAAYKIMAPCDKIIANPFAEDIGSIGSYIPILDIIPLYEKLGAKYFEEYAPQSELKNKWWRSLKEGDNADVQKYLQEHTQSFIDEVKMYRPQITDDGKVFKGETYKPQDALAIGLVDEVMKLEEFINQL